MAHLTQNNHKGIVLEIGVQIQRKSTFMILLSSKTLKTLIFPKIIIRNRTKKWDPKSTKISFYGTFIIQNCKMAHFTPNNYKGIVLKIGVQN